jgi:hypothetical protein
MDLTLIGRVVSEPVHRTLHSLLDKWVQSRSIHRQYDAKLNMDKSNCFAWLLTGVHENGFGPLELCTRIHMLLIGQPQWLTLVITFNPSHQILSNFSCWWGWHVWNTKRAILEMTLTP